VDEGCVLVGTDFSPGSTAALEEARRLAARLGCPVRVVHVVESESAQAWQPSGAARGWLDAAEMDEQSLDVRFGSAWVELARYADRCRPALLVVGSHGASGYQPVSVGTTAERLTLNARHSVLLVGPRHSAARRPAGTGRS
jgi:nucleotide-binding universal stress UspA family protein